MIFKKKGILIAFILMGFFAFSVIFLGYPLIKDIENRTGQLVEVKKDLNFITTKSESINSIKEKYLSIKSDIDKIDSFLIDSENPIDIIELWEQEASKNGLQIEISASKGKEETDDYWPYLIFQIRLNGPFIGLMRFFEKLESSQYLIDITGFGITSPKIESQSQEIPPNYVNANFNIKAYAK
jgi:Tfp pilus assembly protein PilO